MNYLEKGLEDLLQEYRSADLAVATQAFMRLDPELRRILRPTIALVLPHHAVEDTIQDAMIRVWEGRSSFVFQGLAKWKAYLKVIALRCSLSWLRRNPAQGEMVDVADDPIWDGLTWQAIHKLADETWLGYSDRTAVSDRYRQVLAAQYHYQDKLPWQQICQLVNGRPATTKDRQVLDGWLLNPAVLRHMAFLALYRSGPRLIQHVLDLDRVPDLHQVLTDALSSEADREGPGGWKSCEIAAITWRYGFNFSLERILGRPDNCLPEAKLFSLFERSDAKMPFHKDMAELLQSLGALSESVFTRPRVFKRLAFQYSYYDGIPLRQILFRMEKAADMAGYGLTSGTLNMWLSGRRLVKELESGGADL